MTKKTTKKTKKEEVVEEKGYMTTIPATAQVCTTNKLNKNEIQALSALLSEALQGLVHHVYEQYLSNQKKSKKPATKKTTTKTVAKTENLKKFLIRFKSYSFDNFYMLTTNNKLVDQKTGKLKITAKEFCKTYVPEEYEGWKRRKFEYELFEVWPVGDDGIAEVVNRIGGPFIFTETDRINTNEMPEDVAFFSDSIDFV